MLIKWLLATLPLCWALTCCGPNRKGEWFLFTSCLSFSLLAVSMGSRRVQDTFRLWVTSGCSKVAFSSSWCFKYTAVNSVLSLCSRHRDRGNVVPTLREPPLLSKQPVWWKARRTSVCMQYRGNRPMPKPLSICSCAWELTDIKQIDRRNTYRFSWHRKCYCSWAIGSREHVARRI